MFDWLQETTDLHLAPGVLLARLGVALGLGAVVAGIYVVTQRRTRSDLVPFATTLVLLTVLITMVTLVIGNSVARAFSLAGALAIIRFRTVVEDTRDTAFVIFAVVVGMGTGAGLIIVPLLGTPIVAGAALVLSYFGRAPVSVADEYLLAIRVGLGHDPSSLLTEPFAKHLTNIRLRATATARQGAALDLNYLVCLRHDDGAVPFVAELNQVEGIQSVELRRQ